VCGRMLSKPDGRLPRHLFCLAMRKRPYVLIEGYNESPLRTEAIGDDIIEDAKAA